MRAVRHSTLYRAMAAALAAAICLLPSCSNDASDSSPTATTLNPADALFNAGVERQDAGDLEGAIARYDQAIAADATYVAAWYNRAVAKQNLGRDADAVVDYRKVVELDPKNARALYNLGNLLVAQGVTDEGVQLVRRATELDPSLRGDAAASSTSG